MMNLPGSQEAFEVHTWQGAFRASWRKRPEMVIHGSKIQIYIS